VWQSIAIREKGQKSTTPYPDLKVARVKVNDKPIAIFGKQGA